MNILKTANGRLRIDPEAIRAIETVRPKWKEDDDRGETGVIVLEEGIELYGPTEEITEIADQWQEYLDGDDDDEEDDQDDLKIPDSIDVTPERVTEMARRRRRTE